MRRGKGCVFTYDAVGSYERVGYSAQGSGSTLIMPFLDNQLKSPSPLLLPAKDAVTPLSELEAIDLVKTCFASATQKDIYTGDKLEIMVLNVDGIRYIALTLLQRKPELACVELFALNVLAENCSSFRSGTSLNFWQSLIYSGIESKSSHPMVAALIDYAQTFSIEVKPERVEEFENFRGEGVHGKEVYVGNQKIALRARCATAPSIGHCGEGKSIGYVFLGAAPAGIFSLSDSCQTGAREAINELKSMNVKTVMLTGDSHEAAIEAQKQLAGALGVVHDGLLPKDKAQIISNFQKEAPTAMVGDGVNDAPALFATHVYQQLLAKTSLKS